MENKKNKNENAKQRDKFTKSKNVEFGREIADIPDEYESREGNNDRNEENNDF